MPLDVSQMSLVEVDPMERITEVLEVAGWQFECEDNASLHAVADTRWGDMGALFTYRTHPAAIHFTLTLDVKPQKSRRAALNELIVRANERLWMGHFDYWSDDDVITFRATLPLLDRAEPSMGEIQAVVSASVSAAERFIPAFNFLIWAGKSPKEAMEAAMFETAGEA